MNLITTVAVAALLAAPADAPQAAQRGTSAMHGVWRNGKDSVRIRTYPCGASLCGEIIEADAKAQADAARGGTRRLVGTQIFRNFTPVEAGRWRGKVFVPDLNRTFSGSLRLDAGRLLGKGCILGGLICKSSSWTRVS